jgi:hypothetical protein
MVADVPQEERAQIDAVEHRLAQKYAELPHDHVAGVVQHVYARFNQSKLRDFVPLLVERRAGEQRALSTVRREAVANPDCAVGRSENVDVGHVATRNRCRRQALTRWRLTLGISRR